MAARVLVVDDDPSILGIVTEMLRDEGYEVTGAADGSAALDAVSNDDFALVILDMRMPVMDGWGFAREMRARGQDLPIVVMTAAQDARRWAEEIAAVGYIAKPFDLDEFLGEVQRALTDHGRGRSDGPGTLASVLIAAQVLRQRFPALRYRPAFGSPTASRGRTRLPGRRLADGRTLGR
jgi:DNA-binding response OmpR family regulator